MLRYASRVVGGYAKLDTKCRECGYKMSCLGTPKGFLADGNFQFVVVGLNPSIKYNIDAEDKVDVPKLQAIMQVEIRTEYALQDMKIYL